MVLPLPPEILQLVLSAALEDEAPPQRPRIRQAFVCVCRGWAASVVRFQQLEIIGSYQLIRLTSPLPLLHARQDGHFTQNSDSTQAACEHVQSLYIELSDTDDFAPTEVADDALARLLNWCPNVSRLEIRIGERDVPAAQVLAAGSSGRDEGEGCSLSDTIKTALAGLTQLISFTLGGLSAAQPVPSFSPHSLRL